MIGSNTKALTSLEMAKNCIARYDLQWPVDFRMIEGPIEGIESFDDRRHLLYLCPDTAEHFLNELTAAAKLAEMYDEPRLCSFRFEDEESKAVKEEYAGQFFTLVMPVRNVWLQRVNKECMTPKEYKEDLDFIEEIYMEWQQIGEHAETPFNFFAYYLLLEQEGRSVPAPPQLKRYGHAMWQFSRLANAEPSVGGLVAAYNTFAPPGLPRAELSEDGKIRFLA